MRIAIRSDGFTGSLIDNGANVLAGDAFVTVLVYKLLYCYCIYIPFKFSFTDMTVLWLREIINPSSLTYQQHYRRKHCH